MTSTLHVLAIFFFGSLAGSAPALAEKADEAAPVSYTLKGVRPSRISQYSLPNQNLRREYFHLRGEAAEYYLIYEEKSSEPTLPELKPLRESMGNQRALCDAELECRTHAFCTGTCRNIYFETSNDPPDPKSRGRNHCVLKKFHCEEAPAAEGKP